MSKTTACVLAAVTAALWAAALPVMFRATGAGPAASFAEAQGTDSPAGVSPGSWPDLCRQLVQESENLEAVGSNRIAWDKRRRELAARLAARDGQAVSWEVVADVVSEGKETGRPRFGLREFTTPYTRAQWSAMLEAAAATERYPAESFFVRAGIAAMPQRPGEPPWMARIAGISTHLEGWVADFVPPAPVRLAGRIDHFHLAPPDCPLRVYEWVVFLRDVQLSPAR